MSNLDQKTGQAVTSGGSNVVGHAPASIVNPKRRKLAGLGIGAPVIMTLSSRNVFAGQCLSNMMSGNLSNPERGNCTTGWSPGGWGQSGGKINGYRDGQAWTRAGFNRQTSTMGDVPYELNRNMVPKDTKLAVVLTTESYKPTRHLLTAYLNAKLSESVGSGFQYILSTQQVLDLAAGRLILPPPYNTWSINDFLDTTWT